MLDDLESPVEAVYLPDDTLAALAAANLQNPDDDFEGEEAQDAPRKPAVVRAEYPHNRPGPDPQRQAGRNLQALAVKSNSELFTKAKSAIESDPFLKRYWSPAGEWIGEPGGVDSPAAWRMERFVQEFMIDYNAGRAAMVCGLSDGQRLKKDLAPVIRARASTIAGRCGITAERILREYAKIAFGNIGDYVDTDNSIKDLSGLDREKTAAIESIQTKRRYMPGDDGGEQVQTTIKMSSKQSALDALGKHLGIFNADMAAGQTKTAPVIILYGDEKSISITQPPKQVQSNIIDDDQDV